MNNKKIHKILVLIITAIFTFTMYSVCYADSEKITNDFELNSFTSYNDEIIYGCYVVKDNELKVLSINAKEFNLPSNLYDYKDDIRMRVTYSEEDYKVYDCKVINYKTGEIIEDLSEENINKLFNIEYGKNITEKSWSDKIKLSEINENIIYKYTANSTTQFPKIENDIGKNCIIYIKEKDDKTYKKQINMSKQISGSGISTSFNEYNSGDMFCIMYKSLENSELLNLIKKDEIIYLSKYKDGDNLKYQFEKYIYNDTDKNITVNTENSNSVIIEKGEIYGFDWMIDSATISYEKDNNEKQNDKVDKENNNDGNNQSESKKEETDKVDKENNNDKNNQSELKKEETDKVDKENNNDKNNQSEPKKEEIDKVDKENNNDRNNQSELKKGEIDNTVVQAPKLPKTGTSNVLIIMLLSVTTIMIIIWIKLRKLKDIE